MLILITLMYKFISFNLTKLIYEFICVTNIILPSLYITKFKHEY